MVVTESELAPGAQHAVGRHTAHRALRDDEAARQGHPDPSQRHVIAQREVRRAADDLERSVARIDDHQANAVSSLDRPDLVNARHDDVTKPFAHPLDPLHDQSEVVERGTKLVRRLGKVHELAQPRKRNPHENCLRKRTSFSMSARMSPI